MERKRGKRNIISLVQSNSELLNEWDYEKNVGLDPKKISYKSGRKVWWIGKCGHSWDAVIGNRTNGFGCPICSHQRLLVGYNDFATEHPELVGEWDYEKNDRKPTEIMSHSHYKAWWICPFGHSYQAWMDNRCGAAHTGCTVCNKEKHTSFPEQALYFYIKKFFPDAVNSDKGATGVELDIYIPSHKIAVEYDGYTWHKNNKYELKKNAVCQRKNINLIRIREVGLEMYDNCYCLLRTDRRTSDSLSQVIKETINVIDETLNPDVDVERDFALIYSSYVLTKKDQSLMKVYPDIANEWHPTKNGLISPELVSSKSSKMVWWLGKCGHEWPMSVQDRTEQNCGCPICSGKRIVSGINDLLTKYPEICKEWDYELNSRNGLYPDQIAPHSDKKAYWKCSVCGHSWRSKIDGRTGMNAGCPKCKDRLVAEAKFKAVRCIETGIEYESLKAAGERTGINCHCISNCCKGKQKTAGKMHWEFLQ